MKIMVDFLKRISKITYLIIGLCFVFILVLVSISYNHSENKRIDYEVNTVRDDIDDLKSQSDDQEDKIEELESKEADREPVE